MGNEDQKAHDQHITAFGDHLIVNIWQQVLVTFYFIPDPIITIHQSKFRFGISAH